MSLENAADQAGARDAASTVQLETLEAKGLIRLAAVRPELEYLFRHALVQDAAYGSLLKQERRELHARVGEALEALYPDRREELAPVLAMHFEQAGESEKAIDYLVTGGQHALQQNAIVEAFTAYDQAATLSDPAVEAAAASPEEASRRRHRRIEILLGRAEAGYSFVEPEESVARLEANIDEAEAVGDQRLIARLHLFIAISLLQAGQLPDSPRVKRSLDRIGQAAEALADPALRVTPQALIGMSHVFTGPVREGVAMLEAALPDFERGGDSIGASFARGAFAIGLASLGEFDKAEAAAARAKQIAEKGDLIAQLDALISEAYVRSQRGQLDRAMPLASECVERAEQTGASACMVVSSWILGDAFHRQGRFAEARDVLLRGRDVSSVLDRRVWRPTLQAWLGTTLAVLGDGAEVDYEEALSTAREIHNRPGEAGVLAKRGEAGASRGDIEAASADFMAAAAIDEELGLRPALARTLRSWGEALRRASRVEEATPILERAIAVFDELGLAQEASVVRTELSLGGATLAYADPPTT